MCQADARAGFATVVQESRLSQWRRRRCAQVRVYRGKDSQPVTLVLRWHGQEHVVKGRGKDGGRTREIGWRKLRLDPTCDLAQPDSDPAARR